MFKAAFIGIIVAVCFTGFACSKKHACDCLYTNGEAYNIVESSNGDCSEWNEPNKGVTCKVVD